MRKSAGNTFSSLKKFKNINTKIKLSAFLEYRDIKITDEPGFGDTKKIDLEKNVEFGICDIGTKTEISFEFGTIKIEKGKFKEALKRYLGRNEFLKKI